MSVGSQATTETRADIANLPHRSRYGRLRDMPRSSRRVFVESPESRALDEARRLADRTEAILERQLEDLKAKAIAAVVTKKLSTTEAARRAGYSREYVSKLVSAYTKTHASPADPP